MDIVKNKYVRGLATVSFVFFFAAILVAIFIGINYPFAPDDTSTPLPNTIGDFLGGVLNPFFTLCAVCVTALAFYAQYDANKIIQEEAKIREFESQFYEMMRVHQNNIDRLSIQGMNFRRGGGAQDEMVAMMKRGKNNEEERERFYFDIQGPSVFIELHKEIEILIQVYLSNFGLEFNKDDYGTCYCILFNGIDYFESISATEVYSDFLSDLRCIQNAYNTGNRRTTMSARGTTNKIAIDIQHYPFEGYGYIIGNQFRQLFQAVKFVVESEIIVDYTSKMKYLNMLRAQMTYEEVIILFYNWIGYAPQWENETNSYLCDYRMIHNLWHTRLHKNSYTHERLWELQDRRSGLHDNPVFEFDL